MNAITEKDNLRLETPAKIPINGGPMRKPKKLIVETAASAIPGDSVFDFPAALYTSGTIDDTPMPTSKNPAMDG